MRPHQTKTHIFVLISLAFAIATTGCKPQTDTGTPCVLKRRLPDGGTGDILEKEVTAGKDFVSFGAIECEDLVCVRDANTAGGTNPEGPASGFCSRPCVETSATSCDTGNNAIDDGPDRFACRPLLLDTETLARLRQNDPEKYQRYFGDTQSPFFCAKPRADAGQ